MNASKRASGDECGACFMGTCDRHCGGRTKGGGLCRRPAGAGTNHVGIGRCKHHLGSTRNHVKSAQKEMARQAVVTFGLPREIDPHSALLEELHRTAGAVAWLNHKIAEMGEDELTQADADTKYERPSVWLAIYQDERDRYAKVAKAAIDAGIEERRVRMAELQGELVAQLLRDVVADIFGLLAAAGIASDLLRRLQNQEVPTVVRSRLMAQAELEK